MIFLFVFTDNDASERHDLFIAQNKRLADCDWTGHWSGHSPDNGSDVEDTVEAGDDGGPGPERQTEAAGVVRCEAR